MEQKVTVIDHPLVTHKLTLMRKKSTSSSLFRSLLKEISSLMMFEITKDLKLVSVEIETPITSCKQQILENENIVLVPILRAGLGLIPGFLDILPLAKIGHIGIYRDHSSNSTIEYYFKMPSSIKDSELFIIDPMIATGNSSSAAISRLKSTGPKSIKLVSLLCSPEGLEQITMNHPDVKIYTAAIDKKLDEKGYIFPGLGDAGDRLFGTL